MDELLTVEQAARELGVTPETVRYRLRTGRMQGQRVGRDWVIARAHVDAARGLTDARGWPAGKPRKVRE